MKSINSGAFLAPPGDQERDVTETKRRQSKVKSYFWLIFENIGQCGEVCLLQRRQLSSSSFYFALSPFGLRRVPLLVSWRS